MRNRLHFLYTAIFACLAFVACQWSLDFGKDGRAVTDVKIHRYDKLIDEYVELNSFSALQKSILISIYPNILFQIHLLK